MRWITTASKRRRFQNINRIHLLPFENPSQCRKSGRQRETLGRLAWFRRTKPERLTRPVEDVVDSTGSYSSGSRRNRAAWAAHSEGSAERAGFEQGPPISEPQSSKYDRHHNHYDRETRNFLSFSRTFVLSRKYKKIVATFEFYVNKGPVVELGVFLSLEIYWFIDFFLGWFEVLSLRWMIDACFLIPGILSKTEEMKRKCKKSFGILCLMWFEVRQLF